LINPAKKVTTKKKSATKFSKSPKEEISKNVNPRCSPNTLKTESKFPRSKKNTRREKNKISKKNFRVAKKCTKIGANVPKMHLFRKPRNGRVEAEKFRLGKPFQRLRQKNERLAPKCSANSPIWRAQRNKKKSAEKNFKKFEKAQNLKKPTQFVPQTRLFGIWRNRDGMAHIYTLHGTFFGPIVILAAFALFLGVAR